jgi:putative redox protein
MRASLRLERELRLIGTNESGKETFFDTTIAGGGLDSAASPMEVLLESLAACMAMDVVPILRKQRRTVTDFSVDLTAERAPEHPRVFTKIAMDIHLSSPDATMKELVRAIELSETKYCSASAMISRSGCEITWKATLQSPGSQSIEHSNSDEAH